MDVITLNICRLSKVHSDVTCARIILRYEYHRLKENITKQANIFITHSLLLL